MAREAPYAACVVVWREGDGVREYLVLHRAHKGPEYEGDWAWTPRSEARLPGETAKEAAERELREETGLSLALAQISVVAPSEDVAIYVAEAPEDADVILDAEHDAFLWLPLQRAAEKCMPPEVAACVMSAASSLTVSRCRLCRRRLMAAGVHIRP